MVNIKGNFKLEIAVGNVHNTKGQNLFRVLEDKKICSNFSVQQG